MAKDKTLKTNAMRILDKKKNFLIKLIIMTAMNLLTAFISQISFHKAMIFLLKLSLPSEKAEKTMCSFCRYIKKLT